jgi:hypothetical protein
MREQMSVPEAPSLLKTWIASHTRTDAIDNHGFELNLAWWNQRIGHLPGSPVTDHEGVATKGRISRRSLFDLAADTHRDETGTAALRLFWHTLVWGTGSSHRNSPRRIRSVETNPQQTGRLLRDAALLAVTDPRAAFLKFQPRGNAIKSLGPNFFTKYLYFAGGGNISHPCPIVDKRVLTSLYRETQLPVFQPKTTNYGFRTYDAAVRTMSSWAHEVSTSDRTVGVDEIERWAFATGK